MGFFNDDSFDRIVREFFGESPLRESHKEKIIHGEEENRVIDYSESDGKVYIIFELPGYEEEDVSVMVRGKELEISAKKMSGKNIQGYLVEKLRHGVLINKEIPKFINPKKFSYKLKNGVLEIIFIKK